MKRLILYLLLAFSCTKEADIDPPDTQKKPVITCFISPDEPQISVRVGLSIPRFGIDSTQQKTYLIKDAQVEIKNSKRRIVLTYDASHGIYTASDDTLEFLRPGFIYTLSVQTSTYGIITATTQIPSQTMICDSYLRVNAYIRGPEREYNRMAMIFNAQVFDLRTILSPLDTLLIGTTFITHLEEEGLLKQKSFRVSNDIYVYKNDTSNQNLFLKSELGVMQCDSAFYTYHKRLQLGFENNGNPFADPVMLYSNIKGALGCFGSYRLRYFTFRKYLK
jgi:hypothetical protein